MTSALQFSSREDLVRALNECNWKGWFRESRKWAWDIEEVVRVAVGSNTFRYFRNLPLRPSTVYREWAIRSITQQFINEYRGNGCCSIPNGAGMGWVSNWRQYRAAQGTIKDCAAEAKVPAIALDILAWNQTHKR